MSREIFLVLTQTRSVLSQLIKVVTRAEFNHISISLVPDLDPMWSFGRRRPYNPFWGGFVKEYLWKGTFYRFPGTRCEVLSLKIPEETYLELQNFLDEMYEKRDSYSYNFIGLCFAALGVKYPVEKKYYCSEFVAALFRRFNISGSERFSHIVKPCDFYDFPGAKSVYRGLLKHYPVPTKK